MSCMSHEAVLAEGGQSSRTSFRKLFHRQLGVQLSCSTQKPRKLLGGGATPAYHQLWPYERKQFARNPLFKWDKVNLSSYPHAGVRDFLTKEIYESDADAWRPETVLRTGRLPRGMRYAVDWRYVGGIAPVAGGKFKEGSARRWVHATSVQQCGSTCTITGYRQAAGFSRPAQLGENARIPELGNVAYCPPAAAAPNKIEAGTCDTAHAQRTHRWIWNKNTILNPQHPLLTFVYADPDADPAYGLSTPNHARERALEGTPVNLRNALYGLDGNGTSAEPPEEFYDNDSGEGNELPDVYDSGGYTGAYSGPAGDSNDRRLTEARDIKYTHNTRAHAGKYWSEMLSRDEEMIPYVREDLRVPAGEKATVTRETRVRQHLCATQATLHCARPATDSKRAQPFHKYSKLYLGGAHADTKCKLGDGEGHPRVRVKANYPSRGGWQPYPEPQAAHFSGVERGPRDDETGNPLWVSKNQGVFLTGDMAEASPFLYIMALLDNIGPFVLSNGGAGKSGKNLQDLVEDLDTSYESFGESVLYADHLVTGYGDRADLAARSALMHYRKLLNALFSERNAGASSGHTWAVVGYRFLPDRPEDSYIIGINSHTLSGGGDDQRGVFALKWGFVQGFAGANELRMIKPVWNDYGLPVKYYYDGTEEVPPGGKGGTNEVRGFDKYDYRQTVNFEPKGTSLGSVGDGSNGKHCGLGSRCAGEFMPGTHLRRARFAAMELGAGGAASSAYATFGDSQCSNGDARLGSAGAATPETCKTICDDTAGCLAVYYVDATGVCKMYSSCDVDNDDAGGTVYDRSPAATKVDEQLRFLRRYYDMRPNCLESDFEELEGYSVIGGGCALAGAVDNAGVGSLVECRAICDADEACGIFTYVPGESRCMTRCSRADYAAGGTAQGALPSCGTTTYRKMAPLLAAQHPVEMRDLGDGFAETTNARCWSSGLVANPIDANGDAECRKACAAHASCRFAERIGPSCFIYDVCDAAAAEWGAALYDTAAPLPENFRLFTRLATPEPTPSPTAAPDEDHYSSESEAPADSAAAHGASSNAVAAGAGAAFAATFVSFALIWLIVSYFRRRSEKKGGWMPIGVNKRASTRIEPVDGFYEE